ncbi:Cys-tRNA(Pro)/Cys-tRNA(Cys) deacylase [Psychrosphaera saromensis]|uniref:Cys-tRNA(Pro)/Cys-tRNA(Cys) deacylase n=1 Tax=Psychrosphaera saromensis TaxID=716813 RepID=A0A2S7UVM9_9GAMM|nr:Cys-tRNA(Pro) deacylase [Psychrosphaera saromensis]PQJ53562.1 aminoacyl-tRNA deacylase [Psychrosphaera saromensis]GHB64285.1 Cys-tRNA(Pro)/Cys-tRNA(Cys) deacylase [Psychrosphaera saromensis]GLQ15681.1 Cys-tRNA(Pro)/Cys-tRNA(Cys) deacylase [Psychrosphaera saromensis]
MTPAIDYLKKYNILHQVLNYQHDVNAQSYGLEAASKLNLPEQQVFKTLVVSTEKQQLVVAIIPVAAKLNLKSVAKLISCKKIVMAEPAVVERSSGYILGGVSPFGQKKRLVTVIDNSALQHNNIYVSAGQRGLEIEINPEQLITLLKAKTASLQQTS